MKTDIGKPAKPIAYIGPQNRMLLPEMDHKLEKPEYVPVLIQQAPIQPGHLIVMAVRIVVAKLGISKFISCQKHGYPPAAHQDRAGIAYHPPAQGIYRLILGLPFRPAVPAVIVIASIRVVPSVALIVLFIIGI